MYLTKKDNYFFNDLFRIPFWSHEEQNGGAAKLMKTDVQENENAFVVKMDLPGYAKENIQAEVKDGYLTISATKIVTNEEKEADGKFIRKERFEGSCKRSFYIGNYANEENIQAAYQDGVLRLEIPKEPEPQPEEPKKISIN